MTKARKQTNDQLIICTNGVFGEPDSCVYICLYHLELHWVEEVCQFFMHWVVPWNWNWSLLFSDNWSTTKLCFYPNILRYCAPPPSPSPTKITKCYLCLYHSNLTEKPYTTKSKVVFGFPLGQYGFTKQLFSHLHFLAKYLSNSINILLSAFQPCVISGIQMTWV